MALGPWDTGTPFLPLWGSVWGGSRLVWRHLAHPRLASDIHRWGGGFASLGLRFPSFKLEVRNKPCCAEWLREPQGITLGTRSMPGATLVPSPSAALRAASLKAPVG